jgi:hypothetical protein
MYAKNMPVGEYVSDFLDCVTAYVQEILVEFSDSPNWPPTNQYRNLAELNPDLVESQIVNGAGTVNIRAIRIEHVAPAVQGERVVRHGGRRPRVNKATKERVEGTPTGRRSVTHVVDDDIEQEPSVLKSKSPGRQRVKTVGEDGLEIKSNTPSRRNNVAKTAWFEEGSGTKLIWRSSDDLEGRGSSPSARVSSPLKRKKEVYEFEGTSPAKRSISPERRAGPSGVSREKGAMPTRKGVAPVTGKAGRPAKVVERSPVSSVKKTPHEKTVVSKMKKAAVGGKSPAVTRASKKRGKK